MSLSEERLALLRLLVAGDDYEGVAGILGISAEEVRRRAHEAVSELERSADPGAEAARVRSRLAELDAAGAASAREPRAGIASAPDGSRSLPRRRPLAIAAAAVVAVLAAVLVFVLVLRDGGSEAPEPAPPADQEDVVAVKLEPVGDSGASGTARLLRIEDLPALDLEIEGLARTGAGQTYVIWLLGSGRQGLPIGFRAAGPNGRISGRIPIPSAAASLLPSVEVIDVSRGRQAAVSSAVSRAADSGMLPFHLGTTVLRGELP